MAKNVTVVTNKFEIKLTKLKLALACAESTVQKLYMIVHDYNYHSRVVYL